MHDSKTIALAIEIADDAAAIDLTAYCVAVEDAGISWRQLPDPGRYGEDAAVAQRAADYLERRMRLQRHPGDASLVRLLPRATSSVDGPLQRPGAISVPLCWVPEDELPESLSSAAYDALFPYSRVNIIREFPVFGPVAPVAQDPTPIKPPMCRISGVSQGVLERAARTQPAPSQPASPSVQGQEDAMEQP